MTYLKLVSKYILMLFLMSIAVFIITRNLPQGPADMLLDQLRLPPTEENIERIEELWGLNRPLPVQYFTWIRAFAGGDWGRSLIGNQDIRSEIFRGIPYSVGIGAGGVLVSAFLGFWAGFFSSLKKNDFFDRLTRFFALFAQTIPVFLLSVVIIYIVGVQFQLTKIFTGSIAVKMLLSVAMVSFGSFGSIARTMRTHFTAIREQPYIRAEISRGGLPDEVLLRSGLRPALIGLCSSLISKFSWVIRGTAVVEFVFSVPGVSFFLTNSIAQRDYNVIQSYLFFVVLWMMCVHLFFSVIMRMLGARE